MRRLIGTGILVFGVGGLGWYAAQGPAVAMQADIAAAAQDAVAGAVHGIDVAVSGRDITVSGLAQDEAAVAALAQTLDGIPGRRVVSFDGLETLPVASPFALSASRTADGTVVSGVAPTADARDALGDDVTLAAGAPDDLWGDVARTAVAALEALKQGELVIEDTALTVTGVAATPTDLEAFNAALINIAAPYTVTRDILVEDDGTPLRLALAYDGETLTGSGKISSEMGAGDVSIPGAETQIDVQQALIPSADGQWPSVVAAALAALGAMESGNVDLTDTTLSVTGNATPDGQAAVAAALAGLPDGYTAQNNVALYDDGVPFNLSVAFGGDAVVADGKVPADFTPEMTGGFMDADGVAALDMAFITDQSGTWPGIAQAGFAALESLEVGAFEIAGDMISVTGDAISPEALAATQAALAGYDATIDVVLLDDGTPIRVALTYSAEAGAALSGKLPADVALTDIAETLDLEVTDDGTVQSIFVSEIDMLGPLGAISELLPEVEALTFTATQDAAQFDAVAQPGVDPDALAARLRASLGDSAAVAVTAPADLPAAGATRTNRFTGRQEVFTSGYWLPTFDFAPTPESCAEQSAGILAESQVQFLSGSADLDVPSIRAINALSALARKCAVEGGVFLEVAGHTDNTGNAAANLALSQARADAVRTELLDRGLAQVVVTATGYGDTQPIADNDTDDGRAANRRTAFNWRFE